MARVARVHCVVGFANGSVHVAATEHARGGIALVVGDGQSGRERSDKSLDCGRTA